MLNFILLNILLLFMKSWCEMMILLFLMGFLFLTKDFFFFWEDFFFFFDSFSFFLICLSVWVIGLSILSMNYLMNTFGKMYFMLLNFLLVLFLVMSFIVKYVIMFYIMFECSLIPIFILILGWGYQVDRLNAGLYLMFYTIFMSLPLLCLIIWMETNMISVFNCILKLKLGNSFLFLVMVMAFLVKYPMYGVHLWLLKAHVEAPVAGSMILAGILLKLGGYGLIRFSMFWSTDNIFISIFILLSLWGGFLMSVSCTRMLDTKLLVASSSVVHMSMCVAVMFFMNKWSNLGCLMMLVAHGLCSAGMFNLCGLIYEVSGSRSMFLSKGMLSMFPSLSMMWFLMCSVNMAAPPSLNLLSEIILMIGVVSWSKMVWFPIAFMSFFSACYSIIIYSKTQHGNYILSFSNYSGSSVMEFLVLTMLWAPCNLLLLLSFYFYLYDIGFEYKYFYSF